MTWESKPWDGKQRGDARAPERVPGLEVQDLSPIFVSSCPSSSPSPVEGGNWVMAVIAASSSIECPCTNMCMPSHSSCVRLSVDPWTIARQAPLSMGFSRQEYWRGLPCPPPGCLPNPGIELMMLVAPTSGSLPLVLPGKPQELTYVIACHPQHPY